jgi:hypothetical protein
VVESSLPLPELTATSTSIPDYSFKLLPPGEAFAGEYRWFNRWTFQGEVRLTFAFREKDYLLRFPNQADFLIPRSGPEIRCRPLPDVPDSTVRHLLLDSVIPLILSRREPLVLHASAILFDGRAIAFIGTSGQGKSTLAASYGRLGHAILSDDYLVVRRAASGWVAVPSYPGVRLLPMSRDELFELPLPDAEVAAYTTKRRINDVKLLPFAKSPSKIRCLYVLDDEGKNVAKKPLIERVPPRETFIKLVSSSFNLDITDKDFLRRQFVTLKNVVATLPCFRLRYKREFGKLPAVSKAIADHQEGIRNVHRSRGSSQDPG